MGFAIDKAVNKSARRKAFCGGVDAPITIMTAITRTHARTHASWLRLWQLSIRRRADLQISLELTWSSLAESIRHMSSRPCTRTTHTHTDTQNMHANATTTCKASNACTQCSVFHCSGRDLNAFPARNPRAGTRDRFHSFSAHFCWWSLRPWETLGSLPRLVSGHGSFYLFCRRHQCRGRWAPPRPLLRGSCRNPLQCNPATKDTNVKRKRKK